MACWLHGEKTLLLRRVPSVACGYMMKLPLGSPGAHAAAVSCGDPQLAAAWSASAPPTRPPARPPAAAPRPNLCPSSWLMTISDTAVATVAPKFSEVEKPCPRRRIVQGPRRRDRGNG
jgi:hypothetical protein